MSTVLPPDLKKALHASPGLEAAWNDLTPIGQRDFLRWITSAKQAETRKRRIAIACSKLASGKRRPCCYAVVPMCLYSALGANPKAKATWSDLTPDERRDIVDWVDETKNGESKTQRAEKACAKLAAGKRQP